MNTTLCMKLVLFLSFLALSDAWLWRRGPFFTIKRGNLAGKGPEQGSPAAPLQAISTLLIVGEIDELQPDIAALTARVDELENNFEELSSAIEGQEDALLQRVESRLNEKKSEQKQTLSRGTPTN